MLDLILRRLKGLDPYACFILIKIKQGDVLEIYSKILIVK